MTTIAIDATPSKQYAHATNCTLFRHMRLTCVLLGSYSVRRLTLNILCALVKLNLYKKKIQQIHNSARIEWMWFVYSGCKLDDHSDLLFTTVIECFQVFQTNINWWKLCNRCVGNSIFYISRVDIERKYFCCCSCCFHTEHHILSVQTLNVSFVEQ